MFITNIVIINVTIITNITITTISHFSTLLALRDATHVATKLPLDPRCLEVGSNDLFPQRRQLFLGPLS